MASFLEVRDDEEDTFVCICCMGTYDKSEESFQYDVCINCDEEENGCEDDGDLEEEEEED